jgi:hypothetical protein
MIEICEAMINFGRHDETEEIPKPNFGGSRRMEFLVWCNKVEEMFAESLKSVQDVRTFPCIVFTFLTVQTF